MTSTQIVHSQRMKLQTSTELVEIGDEVLWLKLIETSSIALTKQLGWQQGQISNFNGSSYLTVPYSPSINTSQFTFGCWFKIASIPNNYTNLVATYTHSPSLNYSGYTLYLRTDNRLYAGVTNSGSNASTSVAVFLIFGITQWLHLIDQC